MAKKKKKRKKGKIKKTFTLLGKALLTVGLVALANKYGRG